MYKSYPEACDFDAIAMCLFTQVWFNYFILVCFIWLKIKDLWNLPEFLTVAKSERHKKSTRVKIHIRASVLPSINCNIEFCGNPKNFILPLFLAICEDGCYCRVFASPRPLISGFEVSASVFIFSFFRNRGWHCSYELRDCRCQKIGPVK